MAIAFLPILLLIIGLSAQLAAGNFDQITTVFVVAMENHDWSEIKGSPDCPYINNTLLPMASHAERYYSPLGVSPSEPNWLWLEAGTSFGIANDKSPRVNHQKTTNHLVSQLTRAGISWKSYQENITGKDCPVTSKYPYAVWHNPFVYFDDVVSDSTYCTNHIRPYQQLHEDLKEHRMGRYNLITPNLTNIMHDTAPGSRSSKRQGDRWLARAIPPILASDAYQTGVIFIVWDEGSTDGPIGLIVLSPFAKGQGYSNRKLYTHSSLLRTVQEILGVRPFLRDAANAQDLSDLFRTVRFTGSPLLEDARISLGLTGIPPGKSIILEKSVDLSNWLPVQTNSSSTGELVFEESDPSTGSSAFFRTRESP